MPTLTLPVILTHSQASACAQQLVLDIKASNSDTIIIDASALDKFDSSALAVLLQCRRETNQIGKKLDIHGLPIKLQSLADVYGIQSLLVQSQ